MLKKATDNIKTALEIADSIRNLELKSSLLDLKEEILELRVENLSLKEKLNKRESINIKFDNGVYWKILDSGEREKTPCCQKCWDVDTIAVHLKIINNAICKGDIHNVYHCPQCQNEYMISN